MKGSYPACPARGGNGRRLTTAIDAFWRTAEMRGSQTLWKKWEQAKDVSMTLERANPTIEVPSKIEDGMLATIFSIRVVSSRHSSLMQGTVRDT